MAARPPNSDRAARLAPQAAFLLGLAASALSLAPDAAHAGAPGAATAVDGAYLSGIVAGAIGDPATASDKLLTVLAHDPAAPGVRAEAFIYATMAGAPEAASLAAQNNDNPLAPLVLGNEAARHGDWAAAEQRYNTIVDSPLNGLLRPLLVAWSQQGAGHTDLALATLLPLTQNNPVAGVYALHAAMIADLAERSSEAARLYQLSLSLYPGSDLVFVQSYASFLARSGNPAAGRAVMHALVHALPGLAIAEPGLDAALASPPVTTARQGMARAFLTIASLIQQQGARGHEAEGFMVRFALDLQHDLTPASLLLADLQNAGGQSAQALALLRAIPAHDPLAPVADLRAGEIEASIPGQRAQAHAMLERLTHDFPQRPEPLQALADLLQDDGQYAASIAAYDRAIALMSPLGNNDWPVLFARATAYDRAQLWTRAQSDLQHALQLAPNEPFLLNYLGYSWVERNQDIGPARQMIERALSAKPDDGSIRDSLGWAMFRQNDVAGAVQQLERAAEQMPEDPTVNYHLGAAYWAAGRHVEARDQWRWALNLHPDPRDAARIRAALRSSMRPDADPVVAADAVPRSVP